MARRRRLSSRAPARRTTWGRQNLQIASPTLAWTNDDTVWLFDLLGPWRPLDEISLAAEKASIETRQFEGAGRQQGVVKNSTVVRAFVKVTYHIEHATLGVTYADGAYMGIKRTPWASDVITTVLENAVRADHPRTGSNAADWIMWDRVSAWSDTAHSGAETSETVRFTRTFDVKSRRVLTEVGDTLALHIARCPGTNGPKGLNVTSSVLLLEP